MKTFIARFEVFIFFEKKIEAETSKDALDVIENQYKFDDDKISKALSEIIKTDFGSWGTPRIKFAKDIVSN